MPIQIVIVLAEEAAKFGESEFGLSHFAQQVGIGAGELALGGIIIAFGAWLVFDGWKRIVRAFRNLGK